MHNQPGSVTLIFRELEKPLRKEHPMNLLAAWATRSRFSHVEIAIGDACGADGQMRNVLRVFNDDIGVELVERTGRNPVYRYIQLGCSKACELKMLHFAKKHVGDPFDMWAMVRSIVWPRRTVGTSWYCAELSAACLQAGGLFPTKSNPGACTPESLWKQYIPQAATTGNPCTLRAVRYEQTTVEELQPLLRPRRHERPQELKPSTLTFSMDAKHLRPVSLPASSPSTTGLYRTPVVSTTTTPRFNIPSTNRAEHRLRQAVQEQNRLTTARHTSQQPSTSTTNLELQPFALLKPLRT